MESLLLEYCSIFMNCEPLAKESSDSQFNREIIINLINN